MPGTLFESPTAWFVWRVGSKNLQWMTSFFGLLKKVVCTSLDEWGVSSVEKMNAQAQIEIHIISLKPQAQTI